MRRWIFCCGCAVRSMTKLPRMRKSISVFMKQRYASSGEQTIGSPRTLNDVFTSTPHPVACYTKPIRMFHPAGNGRPLTYIACPKPRYPVSAGMHEKVQAMPHVRYRPIEAGHNCIISAPDLVVAELLEIPR